MQQRLEHFGGSGERLLFAHANGYPPGSYREFVSQLTGHVSLTAYFHRPMWSAEDAPSRVDWNGLADDLLETVRATQSSPIWMMGHSMGAAVSIKAAAREPGLFKGLILIDPILFETRRNLAITFASDESLDSMPMVQKTLSRPDRFADEAAAFDFHRGKRAFSRFSDEVLWDYIRAGTKPHEDGGVRLAFPREWEAAAYKSTVWLWRDVARLDLPVLGLRGRDSDTLSPAAFQRWQRVLPAADLRECDGGHLLPMEHPRATAACVIEFLQQYGVAP